MAIKKVILKNVKAIKKMEFELPSSNGVYLLTGLNGCGKSSLLIALDRIKDNTAFRNFVKSNRGSTIDNLDNYKISYYDEESNLVSYKRANKRWAPSPKKQGRLLWDKSQFWGSYFISATGKRFYTLDPSSVKDEKLKLKSVAQAFAKAMSDILEDNRFKDLCYYQIDRLYGRQKALHREKKFYVLKSESTYYSERNFSLGERLVLNALDSIEQVKDKALLLVDEIELALHPTAQERFYNYLCNIAKEKNLMVFIATHSSTLIKLSPASNTYYLKKSSDGNVTIDNSCSPAYILKDISINQDRCPDLMIFVEDLMAKTYLQKIIDYYRKQNNSNALIHIVYLGGFKQVIETAIQYFTICPFNRSNVQVFLDGDVKKETLPLIEEKGLSARQGQQEIFNSIRQYKDNISFLDITPELGLMSWYKDHWKDLEQMWAEYCKEPDFKIPIDLQRVEELDKDSVRQRQQAKCWLNRLVGTLIERGVTTKHFEDCKLYMMEIYAEYQLTHKNLLDVYVDEIRKCLNRANTPQTII